MTHVPLDTGGEARSLQRHQAWFLVHLFVLVVALGSVVVVCVQVGESAELPGVALSPAQPESDTAGSTFSLPALEEIYLSKVVLPSPVVTGAVVLGTAWLVERDQDLADGLLERSSQDWEKLMAGYTHVGNVGMVLGAAGLLALSGEQELAEDLAHATLYSNGWCLLLKTACGRARPLTASGVWDPLNPDDSYHSFPSGHTATAFAAATVLGKYYPRYRPYLYGLAVLVGLSRVYTQAHWPADVFLGAALGVWGAGHTLKSTELLRLRF